VVIVLFSLPGECPEAPSSFALTMPFALPFFRRNICPEICVEIPANLLSLGRAGFRAWWWTVSVVHRRETSSATSATAARKVLTSVHKQIREATHEVQRPVFFTARADESSLRILPIFTLQSVEGTPLQAQWRGW